ncbi:MAG: type IX secretion system membrane protein PorP/SprF [Crocinitomicaceae bacterium]|nr:type IX secretion system membrane protein PorP/SprF [Crocinitomicaceae bacterium]
MRKVLYSLVATFFIAALGMADATAQDPEFTQFYANPLYLNPAFAGTARCPRLVMNYRNQWPSLSGTFVTTSASYDQHVETIQGGLGLLVVNDRAAQNTLNTTTLSGMYSYQQPITRKFSVKAGLQASYFQKSLDWSKLTFGDMIDPRKGFIYETQDIPRGGKVSNVDFSAGILGFSDIVYGGFAVHHLNEPNESLIVGTSRLPMKFTAHAGAVIPIQKKRRDAEASISPNVLYRRQGEFQQLNLGMYVNKGPIVAGVWFRGILFGPTYRDSFIATIGIQTDVVRFGYSYDVTISELTPSTGGSHEVSLAINFDCRPKKPKFRTIACPSF